MVKFKFFYLICVLVFLIIIFMAELSNLIYFLFVIVYRSYKSSVGLGENKLSIRLQALNKTLSTYWLTLTRHPERPSAPFDPSEPHQVCSFKQVRAPVNFTIYTIFSIKFQLSWFFKI